MNPKDLIGNLGRFFSKNSPTILTVCAVGGLVTTVVLAIKATPKAVRKLEEEYERKSTYDADHDASKHHLRPREIIQHTWKCYIPTGAMLLATAGCIIGANQVSLRRQAAVASLYGLTEAAFKEYKDKVTETIGERKELAVRDEISADRVKANPSGSNEIVFTGNGETLFYDSLSGRYFKSDMEKIRKAVNDLNYNLISWVYVSLNEFYDTIGLSHIELGNDIGWNIEKGQIAVTFSTQFSDDNVPCAVLNYEVAPRYL